MKIRHPVTLRHPVVRYIKPNKYVHPIYTTLHKPKHICVIHTAYCISGVISSISNLNRDSSSLGLFCDVPLTGDQGDWDWRLKLNDTPNAMGCTAWCISSVLSSFSNLNRSSSSLGLFCHVPLKRNQWDWDWRLRLNNTLQCVAVCCGVLQCVAVCCGVLQCVAVCCNMRLNNTPNAVGCTALPINAIMQMIVLGGCVLQCVAVCCSVLQCVAVCCVVCFTSSECNHFLEMILSWKW